MNTVKYEIIFFILNKGHVDEAMTAAREAGATGGTIITGRGAATDEVVKRLGVAVQQEKELLLILASIEKRTAIMQAISKAAGLSKPGCGIGFSLPVEDVTGITPFTSEGKEKEESVE